MFPTHALAHYTVSVPTPASVPPAPVPGSDAGVVGDQGAASVGGNGPSIHHHLSHAVQQTLANLHGQEKQPVVDASGQVIPMTIQGFIQALIASLHQLGGGVHAAGQAQGIEGGLQAVGVASGRYVPAAVNDVQSLIQQSTAVLSSNTALQQDFQSMMRAAGLDESSTSLKHFLRSMSSQMKPSSVISAVA